MSRAMRLLSAALVSVLVLSGCSVYSLPLPGGADLGDNPMTVHVHFADVLDLVPQSTVKVDDVTVGKITDIQLDGYTADVEMEIAGNVHLPDNAFAEIRQTSLLGEKFVSLRPPYSNPSPNRLSDGDSIPISHTGRNPEVEEVLGAMSLLLNGGGIGQLKIINEELNAAMTGRAPEARSLLRQLASFMGQLDRNKQQIVAAIESLNRLALQIKQNDDAIKLALDDLPPALKSINSQRAALVRMLEALQRLSGIGVRVIGASKEATINSLQHLVPVLSQFQKAGQALPKSLQVFLTYPFVDEAVGRDPQVARNLHMGDYTNLSVRLDVTVAALPTLPGGPTLPTTLPTKSVIKKVCKVTKQMRDQVRNAVDQQYQAYLDGIDRAFASMPVPAVFKDQKRALKRELKAAIRATKAAVTRDLLGRLTCKNLGRVLQDVPGAVKRAVRGAANRFYNNLGRVGKAIVGPVLCAMKLMSANKCDRVPKLPLPGDLPTKLPTGGGLTGGGLTGGLPRTATAVDPAAVRFGDIDVLNGPHGTVGQLGYNSTLGALLLQGVAQ